MGHVGRKRFDVRPLVREQKMHGDDDRHCEGPNRFVSSLDGERQDKESDPSRFRIGYVCKEDFLKKRKKGKAKFD